MVAPYVDAVIDVLQATTIWVSFIIVVVAVALIAVVAAAAGLVREAAVAVQRQFPSGRERGLPNSATVRGS